ncbi:MAG TPA: response regulator [bacterium]|nr:response regulator [bacterium]
MEELESRRNTGPKILVVDDDPQVAKVIRKALESAGYQVLEAAHGKAAVELMAQKPDLVLQDLVLPDITGYDLVAKLRFRTQEKPIPFLALSGYMAMPEEPWDTGHGFDALVVKPVSPSELVKTVKTWLEKGHSGKP